MDWCRTLMERNVTMKRSDAFMLAVTAFVLANCVSYFDRSGEPYVTGWGVPASRDEILEGLGFPFEIYILGVQGLSAFSWLNLFGNLLVALLVSYLFSFFFAHCLPSLWPGQTRILRYPLRALLGSMTVAAVLLGLAMMCRSLGLVVRNTVCLAGPVGAVATIFYWRRASWPLLVATAVGLTLLTLAVDIRYQDPPIDLHQIGKAALRAMDLTAWGDREEDAVWYYFTRFWVAITITRATVPVFGLMSLLVIASGTYSVIRQYRALPPE